MLTSNITHLSVGTPILLLVIVNNITLCKNITLPQTSFAGGKKLRYQHLCMGQMHWLV